MNQITPRTKQNLLKPQLAENPLVEHQTKAFQVAIAYFANLFSQVRATLRFLANSACQQLF
jgi:hypothetical protein